MTPTSGFSRGVRGGSYGHYDYHLASSYRGDAIPGTENGHIGFRVVEVVPVPSAVILGSLGLTFSGLLLHKRKML